MPQLAALPMASENTAQLVTITPETLEYWLEWAGARLIAMPGKHIGPEPYRVIWPDFSQETFQVLQFRKGTSLRANAPTNAEIPLVDEILLFPNYCSRINHRRIIHVRSLIHPVNGRNLYSWSRIAKLFHSNPQNIKRMYNSGMNEVCDKLPQSKVCLIASTLGLTPSFHLL